MVRYFKTYEITALLFGNCSTAKGMLICVSTRGRSTHLVLLISIHKLGNRIGTKIYVKFIVLLGCQICK